LDPEDDNDPTARVNIIGSLCDPASFLRAVRDAPLVASRTFGRVSLRSLAGGAPGNPANGSAPPEAAAAEPAFLDAPLDDLLATAHAIREAIVVTERLEAALTARVGTSQAI